MECECLPGKQRGSLSLDTGELKPIYLFIFGEEGSYAQCLQRFLSFPSVVLGAKGEQAGLDHWTGFSVKENHLVPQSNTVYWTISSENSIKK